MNAHDGKKKKLSFSAAAVSCLAAIVTFISCAGTGTQPTANDRDGIVMRAYLFAGHPVSEVRLVHLTKIVCDSLKKIPRINLATFTFDSVETLVTIIRDSAINNAIVTISNNGTAIRLASRDSGWYQDTSGQLNIVVGQTYRIDVSALGRNAWAQTTVPAPVGGLRASRDTVYMARMGGFGGGGGGGGGMMTTLPDSLTTMTVKWNNPGGAYLYYRCMSDSISMYQAMFRAFIQNGHYSTSDSFRVSTSRNSFFGGLFGGGKVDTTIINLTQAGRYKVYLYTTTPDYRSMLSTVADTSNQDFWSESPTNVHDGLGFFTSFSIDSALFRIVAK